jgi:hypothetical protein
MTDAEVISLSTAESLTDSIDADLDAYAAAFDDYMQSTVALKLAKARQAAAAEKFHAAHREYYGRDYNE